MGSPTRSSRTRPSGRSPSPARSPKKKARSRSLVRRFVRWVVVAGILGTAAAATVLAAAYSELEIPATPPPLQTTRVFDVHGKLIGNYHATIDRTVIAFDDMPVHLREAVLATEDANFYEHRGIDPIGILRALWADLRAGSAVQGGSTITQQLVKSVYAGHYEDDPETGERIYVVPERTVTEKVREALLAIKLERELSKDEILRRYLNTIYFGHGAYGVEAAAQTYWRKPARALTVLQSATLAAAIRSPSTFDPALNPEDSRVRRDWVLSRMVDTGALAAAEAEDLYRRPVKTNPAPDSGFAPRLGYFLDYTRRGLMERYGEGQVYSGGMRITTTLDLAWQRAAETAVADRLPDATGPEAALVAIDPATGAIRAMVGGRDFGVSRVNLATGQGGSGRQAGSAFKVFTLAAAMEDGYALSSVWDGPATITIPDEECYTDGRPWTLSNASDEEAGVFTLRQATAHSVNTIYAQLVTRVGPERVVDIAHRLGIRSDLAPYCAITLGTEAVNPLEMTTAYATLAARGIRNDPAAVLEVADAAGRELESRDPRPVQAMDENDADLVTYALQSVLSEGTGFRARIGRPVAGKTGTAQDYADAWFCGYTPQLATCVWVGYPDAERSLTDIGGFPAVYGGTIPALIWQEFMSAAMADLPIEEFVRPSFDGYTLGPVSPTPVVTPSVSTSPGGLPSASPTASPAAPVTPTPTTSPGQTPVPSPTPMPSTKPPESPSPQSKSDLLPSPT
ncbi:MAG: transglycosylase domain-containing protein [Actinomycetota bacterium]